jgi:hypothetical protein
MLGPRRSVLSRILDIGSRTRLAGRRGGFARFALRLFPTLSADAGALADGAGRIDRAQMGKLRLAAAGMPAEVTCFPPP